MSRKRKKRPCRIFDRLPDIFGGIAETVFDIALEIFFD